MRTSVAGPGNITRVGVIGMRWDKRTNPVGYDLVKVIVYEAKKMIPKENSNINYSHNIHKVRPFIIMASPRYDQLSLWPTSCHASLRTELDVYLSGPQGQID